MSTATALSLIPRPALVVRPARTTIRSLGTDRSLLLAALVTALLGMAALFWSYHSNLVLAYNDASSHLNIARRIVDSRTPGVVQLGTVWLPVPHVLLQPFIYNDFLWQTGLAGSILGLLCFETSAIALFLSIRLITGRELAAWVGLAVFVCNPNCFYIHTTALTEPVLIMGMTVSSYFLLRWDKYGDTSDLLLAGFPALVAVGSRYEGWSFALAATALVFVGAYRRWHDSLRAQALTLSWLLLPLYAMFLWFFYNWLIFGNPLAFQQGQVTEIVKESSRLAGGYGAKGHLALAFKIFTWTTIDVAGGLLIICALAGIACYVGTTRLRPDSLMPFVLLAAYPFNIAMLWLGQTLVTTPQTDPQNFFNMRYGVVLMPGIALFVGYLADTLCRRRWSPLVGILMVALLLGQGFIWSTGWPRSAVVVADGLAQMTATNVSTQAADYLHHHYAGGAILMDANNHAKFVLQSKIDLRQYLDSYSGVLWNEALAAPAAHATWVVLQPDVAGDRVTQVFARNSDLSHQFALQFRSDGYAIYRRVAG